MSTETPAPAPSAPLSAAPDDVTDAADAAGQMAAATAALRSRLPLLTESQPVDPYPM